MSETDADLRSRKYAKDQADAARAAAKQSLIDEANEAKQKMAALSGFINSTGYGTVTEHQQGLLRVQLVNIQSYWQVLQQRLKDWDK